MRIITVTIELVVNESEFEYDPLSGLRPDIFEIERAIEIVEFEMPPNVRVLRGSVEVE